MGTVVQLPLKCPLCDGTGVIEYFGVDLAGMPGIQSLTCSLCGGTKLRPSEEELAARRVGRDLEEDDK